MFNVDRFTKGGFFSASICSAWYKHIKTFSQDDQTRYACSPLISLYFSLSLPLSLPSLNFVRYRITFELCASYVGTVGLQRTSSPLVCCLVSWWDGWMVW